LQRNFEAVLEVVQQTHPWVARSIALSTCRAANPYGHRQNGRSPSASCRRSGVPIGQSFALGEAILGPTPGGTVTQMETTRDDRLDIPRAPAG
jgi:hypothetical protein